MKRLMRASTVWAMALSMVIAAFSIVLSGQNASGVDYQQAADHRDGNAAAENFGRSVAIVDLNDDGISDLVVGAPFDDPGGMQDAGSVTVFLSKDNVTMSVAVTVNGTNAQDLFGWAVADAGDLNGDGASDLAIGAPFADPGGLTDAGNVTILFGGPTFDGSPGAWINSTMAGQWLGYSLAACGDINRDGFDDLAVGAPYALASGRAEAGRTYVYYGGSPMNAVADKTFSGEVAGAHFGWSVSGGWSVDGDTSLDLVVGAPDHTEQGVVVGAAYIIRNVIKANPPVSAASGKGADDKFGFSACMIGDINGDTYGDVAIGAPYNDGNATNAGSVSVLYGGSKFNTAVDLELQGHAANEWFGWAIASGDFREDGYSDLLVGAPNSGLNATSQGRAYAYFGGAAPDDLEDIVLVPDTGAVFFGGALAVGGNMTSDEAPDYAVGDPQFPVGALPNAGRVYVYEGVRVVVHQNPVVNGYVRVLGTTTGINGFTVTLQGDTFSKSATTGPTGYFEFTAVPGTYWLNASKAGYISNSTEVSLAMDEVETVVFYPLTVPLVRGTVRDSVSGLAVSGATVAMYSETALIAHTTTPANGSYTLYLPDDYIPAIGVSTDVTVRAWDGTRYTSSAGVSLARNETEVVNFRLDRFPVVTGTVRDAITLSPVRNALVRATQGVSVLGTDYSDNSGSYSLVAVNASAPGDLNVSLTAAGYYRAFATIAVQKNGSYVQNFFLQIDHITPVSSVDALAPYVGSLSFSVAATASDGIGEVQLWFKNDTMTDFELYASDDLAPYEWVFDASAAGGDGLFEFYSIAVDLAGNTEDPPTVPDASTLVDTVPPEITVTAPAEGEALSAAVIQITWIASDAASGIQGCSAQLDGGAWVDCELNTSCNFTGVAEGLHAVRVNATDNAGVSTIAMVTFVVDRTVPNVTVVWPLEGAISGTPSVLLSWNSSDNISGIALVQVRADDGAWINLSGDATNYTLAGLPDGAHTLTVRVLDAAGLASSDAVQVSVDTLPPSVTIIEPEIGVTLDVATVTVSWTMTDGGSGVARAEVAIDSNMFHNVGLATWYALDNLKDGQHNVTVRVYDNAGHFRDATVTFYVDTTEEDGGPSSTLWLALVIVAAVVVIAAVALLLKRGKGGEKQAQPPQEGVKKAP